MMGANRWATMARGKSKRRPLDDYETPEEVTRALFQFLNFSARQAILEPCSGSGRMVRALRKLRYKRISSSDLKRGRDFLRRTTRFRGHCVTNPPYRGGLAERFARQALKLCDGKVAMLVQSDFVWGKGRASGMYLDGLRPELVVVIPWRIAFFVGKKRTRSHFFSHCWVVWPARVFRAANASTRIEWATREMVT